MDFGRRSKPSEVTELTGKSSYERRTYETGTILRGMARMADVLSPSELMPPGSMRYRVAGDDVASRALSGRRNRYDHGRRTASRWFEVLGIDADTPPQLKQDIVILRRE